MAMQRSKKLAVSKFNIPRILIGATSSGSGKTTITCGILKALKNRGKTVGAFKCGPDYIDPMFHTKVIGINSRNLDLFFNDEDTIKYLLDKNTKTSNCDIAVMEGVMGYYDGVAGKTSISSAYDLARATETPAVLIVDCKGKSMSILAEIKGFLEFEKNSKIKGVILNRISPSMYQILEPLIKSKLNIKPLGYVPILKEAGLQSRHLGLVTAGEIKNLSEIVETIAGQIEETVDIDGLLEIGENAPHLEYQFESVEIKETNPDKKIKIAIAKDDAFCFYYQDNLDLLEKLGCQLVSFSPVAGDQLPKDICGMIFGGGYPELYLDKLSANQTLSKQIKLAIENGMPCLAECGGFMYLHQWIEDEEGNRFNTVGAISGGCYPLKKLGRFGYIDVSLNDDVPLLNKNDSFKAHEFHYWDSENPGDVAHAQKPLAKRNWDCMVSYKNLFAGYPHIHFYSNLNFAKNFVDKCREYGDLA